MDREYIDRPDIEVNAVHDAREDVKLREFFGPHTYASIHPNQKSPDSQTKLANSKQVDGKHYKKLKIEPWDYIEANNIGFLEGSIIKYVSRYQDKNGVRDLEKAKHFLEKLIEERSK